MARVREGCQQDGEVDTSANTVDTPASEQTSVVNGEDTGTFVGYDGCSGWNVQAI